VVADGPCRTGPPAPGAPFDARRVEPRTSMRVRTCWGGVDSCQYLPAPARAVSRPIGRPKKGHPRGGPGSVVPARPARPGIHGPVSRGARRNSGTTGISHSPLPTTCRHGPACERAAFSLQVPRGHPAVDHQRGTGDELGLASSASIFPNMTTAALVTEYRPIACSPQIPASEAMWIMQPRDRARCG